MLAGQILSHGQVKSFDGFSRLLGRMRLLRIRLSFSLGATAISETSGSSMIERTGCKVVVMEKTWAFYRCPIYPTLELRMLTRVGANRHWSTPYTKDATSIPIFSHTTLMLANLQRHSAPLLALRSTKHYRCASSPTTRHALRLCASRFLALLCSISLEPKHLDLARNTGLLGHLVSTAYSSTRPSWHRL